VKQARFAIRLGTDAFKLPRLSPLSSSSTSLHPCNFYNRQRPAPVWRWPHSFHSKTSALYTAPAAGMIYQVASSCVAANNIHHTGVYLSGRFRAHYCRVRC